MAIAKPLSAAGWLYTFALMFCLFGAAMGGFAIYHARSGAPGLTAFAALSGFIFAGVGVGLILILRQGVQGQAATDRLRARHPDQPWLWRDDWATGRIFSEGGSDAVGAWILATFWNAIAWPIFYFIYFNPSHPYGGFEIVSAILPLSGLVMIGYAVRMSLRWLKARGSYFEIDSNPARIGGLLSGTIRLMPPSRANREFKVALSCVHRRITRDGANSSVNEEPLFDDEQTVRGSMFAGIAVYFKIPRDCHQTDITDPDDAVVWRLVATTTISSRTFEARFEIPIFKVAPAPERKSFADRAPEPESEDGQSFEPPLHFPVRIRELSTGATEFYFPPCRAPAAAVAATLFTAGWSAMFLMIIHIDAPIVFDAVWAGFDAFMLFWVASLWLGDTRVTLDDSSITIEQGIPGLALSRHSIPANEVHALAAVTGSRMGRTTYYRLRLIYADDRKLNFGDGLSEKRAAEWLAHQIADHLGARG